MPRRSSEGGAARSARKLLDLRIVDGRGVDTRSLFPSTWLYTCVVDSDEWPSSSWIVRRSAPPSSRCVGERVPQPMRVRADAAQRARVEPASTRGDEERVLGAADELRSRLADVTGEPVRGLLAERDDALLAALAADVDGLLFVVDVHEVESNGRVCSSPAEDSSSSARFRSPRSPSPWPRQERPTPPARGVTGSRRCRLGVNEPRARAPARARGGGTSGSTRASCRSSTARAVAGRAELCGIGGEHARVDVVERCRGARATGTNGSRSNLYARLVDSDSGAVARKCSSGSTERRLRPAASIASSWSRTRGRAPRAALPSTTASTFDPARSSR